MPFDNIRGAKQWAEELKKLVDQARQENDSAKRRELSKALTDFIEASFPSTEDERTTIRELDEMAAVISERILIDDSQERLQAIASRASALAKLQKALKHETAKNLASARSIRLENLQAATTIASKVIESMNRVKADLDEGKQPEKDVRSKIEKAVKSVQDARNLMETFG